MTTDDLRALLPRLKELHHRFHRFFPSSRAPRAGLEPGVPDWADLPIARKNAESLAERAWVGCSRWTIEEDLERSGASWGWTTTRPP